MYNIFILFGLLLWGQLGMGSNHQVEIQLMTNACKLVVYPVSSIYFFIHASGTGRCV